MMPTPHAPASTPGERFSLAPHVRACACGGTVILLDLRNSRYLGIGNAASAVLASRVEDWPGCNSPGTPELPPPTHTDITADLAARGLLVKGDVAERAAPALETATQTINLDESGLDRVIGPRRLFRFAASAATAAWWMRSCSLQAMADAIQRRRRHGSADLANTCAAMHAGVAAYEAMRPLLFTARKECLLDSLALMAFLATEDVFPRWVLGVKTGPFGAHSWVQSGSTVLNDQHEHVRQFVPILVV